MTIDHIHHIDHIDHIDHIQAHPELIPRLALMLQAQWPDWYGPEGPGDAQAELASTSRDRLPLGLAALTAAGAPLGLVFLREHAFSHPELTPWAGGLLVAPGRRGEGVGTALVRALHGEARRLGFRAIHAATDDARGLLERLEWVKIDTIASDRGPLALMVRRLD